MSKVVDGRRLGKRVSSLDGKLAGYLAATASIGALLAKDADAAIVANTTVQPFGINGSVNIDFNSDTQIDFQIDHDRVVLPPDPAHGFPAARTLDYLQVDKNDINGEANPLATDPGIWSTFPTSYYHYTPFPLNSSSHRNDDAMVLSFTNDFGDKGGYAVGLNKDDLIGGTGTDALSLIPGAIWDFQEGSGCFGQGYCRANRLIDEDHGQIDANAGRTVVAAFGPQPEFPGLDDFTGLAPTDVRYLGVRVDLNDAGYPGNPYSNANAATLDDPANYWYGWIGIRITNEADATGEVVGYAYETVKGMSIKAGDTGPAVMGLAGDYNNDHVVNALDYTIWRNHFGEANEANLNNNGDGGTVAETDFTWWKQHYGDVSGPGGGGLAVPEPGSIVLAAVGGMALIGGFVMERLFGRRSR